MEEIYLLRCVYRLPSIDSAFACVQIKFYGYACACACAVVVPPLSPHRTLQSGICPVLRRNILIRIIGPLDSEVIRRGVSRVPTFSISPPLLSSQAIFYASNNISDQLVPRRLIRRAVPERRCTSVRPRCGADKDVGRQTFDQLMACAETVETVVRPVEPGYVAVCSPRMLRWSVFVDQRWVGERDGRWTGGGK